MSSAGSQSSVATSHSCGLPVGPPEELRAYLSPDDWEDFEGAWVEKEAESLLQSVSDRPGRCAYLTEAPKRRGRVPWNDYFQLLGQDREGRPQHHRRYFDPLCGEVVNNPKGRHGSKKNGAVPHRSSRQASCGQRPWVDNFARNVTSDNDVLQPRLRHYFDRRGWEGSYRQRPGEASLTLRHPRTTPREKRDPLQSSVSLPSLSSTSRFGPLDDFSEEQPEDVAWGTRCLLYGPDVSIRSSPEGKIPWICDHHLCESVDNEGIHPAVRHYFDKEGMENSFRNRGRHYGRPKRNPFSETPESGLAVPEWRPPACARAFGSTLRSSASEAPASEGPAFGGPFRSTASSPSLRLWPGLGN